MKKLNLICLSVFVVVLLLNPVSTFGQRYKSGPQDMTFLSSVDESNQPYAIYIPENFDETKKYPLVIFLHGAMSNHRLGLRRAFGEGNIQGPEFGTPGFTPAQTDLEVTRFYPELDPVDYIVVAPFARGTAGYQGIPEQDVFDMLADVKSKFSIDEDRTYLTGLSMGGGGTLWVGLTHPDMFAAIAPVCPAPPAGTDKLAMNASNIPVHLFVGDRDGLMTTSDAWYENFKSIGVDVEYVIYPGIAHNSWEYAFEDGFIFDWFAQFKRDMFPNEVKFTTSAFKYDKAYWVTFDNLVPGVQASIDAKFTGDNQIEITTTELLAFTLKLDGHSMFNADSKVSVKVDGKAFAVKTAGAVSFSKENGDWKNKKFTPNRFSKKKGAEGPLSAALQSNHIYVYGTQGEPSREELQTRQADATHAADWAVDRGWIGRVMIFPRYMADNAVRQSDYETSNLVLFGTAETNSIIKKYEDRLPVQLNEDGDGYGLVYIYPMNGHYVLINSGLPWWTPKAAAEGQGGFSLSPGKGGALDGLPDFILFKGTPDNVISSGYFDNNWEIPETEKSKLKSSGVVTLK
ncbi:alpha/beta hydrolase-fold protein [Draconibacterium sp. IB214405]|uniref:carboxylesterase family protein n=1 Tax=Draconibacterium sp. IB214405 TaxID=3097352 RepID=UPI002A104061|nr:alpha/beta hydrolase-fold protein [Draconibacterium sp. IB214405]MDX8338949.1 alpha/beta hydrolase-fold protein [Draconibacterium sp. IB214405]